MTKVVLSKNYRFRNNFEMLKLDRNIRKNAASNFTPTIEDDEIAALPVFGGAIQKNQQDEARKAVAKVEALMREESAKIAVLFRSRSENAKTVEDEFAKNNIPYFYGKFTEEDTDYVEFHNKCHEMFIKRFGKSKAINKKALLAFYKSVTAEYKKSTSKVVDSLFRLLDALTKKVSIDYADL